MKAGGAGEGGAGAGAGGGSGSEEAPGGGADVVAAADRTGTKSSSWPPRQTWKRTREDTQRPPRVSAARQRTWCS